MNSFFNIKLQTVHSRLLFTMFLGHSHSISSQVPESTNIHEGRNEETPTIPSCAVVRFSRFLIWTQCPNRTSGLKIFTLSSSRLHVCVRFCWRVRFFLASASFASEVILNRSVRDFRFSSPEQNSSRSKTFTLAKVVRLLKKISEMKAVAFRSA